VIIEPLVDRGGHDGDVGMRLGEIGDPFGAGEETNEAQGARMTLLQPI